MRGALATAVAAALVLASVGAVGATTAQPAEPTTDDATGGADASAAGAETAQLPPTQSGPATISVTGTGEATAEPDRATVHVAAIATGNSSAAAAQELAANVSDVTGALEDADEVASVRTVDYDLQRRDDERPLHPPGEPGVSEPPGESGPEAEPAPEYAAIQTLAVEVEDPDATGAVVDVAVEAGATEVRGVSFGLSEERQREVRTDALERAVADAEAEASTIANGTALELGDVRAARSHQGSVGPVAQGSADAAAAGTEIDAREVSVTATVEVVYEAAPANGTEPTAQSVER